MLALSWPTSESVGVPSGVPVFLKTSYWDSSTFQSVFNVLECPGSARMRI